jgi:hypothetical protein
MMPLSNKRVAANAAGQKGHKYGEPTVAQQKQRWVYKKDPVIRKAPEEESASPNDQRRDSTSQPVSSLPVWLLKLPFVINQSGPAFVIDRFGYGSRQQQAGPGRPADEVLTS